jgi:adenine-specific DNA-methyltransferase
MIKKCQVFTPPNNVAEILDRVGYTSNLYGCKVIENACGDGNILTEIVRRYIEDSSNNNISLEDIKVGLETDIYGAEIDKIHFLKCIENLNSVTAKYGINNVSWKILNIDILKEQLKIQFDYVVGNPPYITYRDLDDETRLFVKEKYESCIYGKFDYCYAFIEAGLKCLSNKGKMSYLIPSNIFKNVFAQQLREMMLPYLTKIYDYTTKKLFDNALTSSAIMVFDKENGTDKIEYFDIVRGKSFKILKKNLNGKWIFSKYKEKKMVKKFRFGDFFTASISIATLFNKAYVIDNFEISGEYIIIDEFKVERELIKEAVSPRSLKYNKKEMIIFPYRYEDGVLVKYSSENFESKYPETVKYLKKYIDKLYERKSDTSAQWYEYGRTQALAHLYQEKLLTSTLVTKKVKVYMLDKECIPYSGIYITSKGDLPLSKAKDILDSLSFYEYVKAIGINASGDSIRITAADINNYEFFEREVL